MRTVLYILFASAFTTAVSYGLGRMLMLKIPIPELSRLERRLFRFLLGCALLSLVVFFLCAVHLALKGVFLAGGLVILFLAFRRKLAEVSGPKLPGRLLLFLPFVFFGLIYFIYALAPEVSPDGSTYHLAFVARYYKWHGFLPITTNMYANMPQAMEMLFLFAYAFGRHPAAAMVHLVFLFALALLLWSYGARRGKPLAGAAAGAIVFLSPIFGVDASSAYNDVALAAAAFGCFYLLEIWRENQSRSALILAGVLAGFSFDVKYTGVFVLAYALLIARRKSLTLVIPFALVTLPWLVKSAMIVHNPFSPFFNAVFPNPYIHISFEREYSELMRGIGLGHPLKLPWELAWNGAPGGALGPVFLMLPFGLLALRTRDGRHLWLAATVFAMMFPFNTETRFLIVSAPILALIIMSVISWKPLVYALVAGTAVFAFPPVYQKLRAPTCWSMEEIPIRAALRLQPEEAYISHRVPNYDMARFIDKTVPSNERVLALDTVSEAYTTKTVLVYYESAEAELENDMLLTPLKSYLQPDQVFRFAFPAADVSALNIVQTGSGRESWTMSEIALSGNGVQVPYSPGWIVHANPGRWDTSLALDGNQATSWSTWRSTYPGMSFAIDFPHPEMADCVVIRSKPERVKLVLELTLANGSHVRVGSPSMSVAPIADLRRSAVSAVRQRGTRYLEVANSSPWAAAFHDRQQQWGIVMLGEWGNARLYRLD